MISPYKPIAVFVCICVAFIVFVMVFPRPPQPRLKLGESRVYGVYVEGARVGSWEMSIDENMAYWENEPCYKARYEMKLGTLYQGGWMEFDGGGKLMHARVWFFKNGTAKWATEVAYYPSPGVMRVVRENYEDNSCADDFIPMLRETTISEHLWYLLRLEPLELAYLREFDLNAFPDATRTVSARVDVVGEQRVDTSAGTFDCWLVRGDGPFDWMWVEKSGRVVVKVVERSGGLTRTYSLESYT